MKIPSNDFQIRNQEVEARLKRIGDGLRTAMPKGYGFVLLIASSGEGGATFYISSHERENVIAMMREFIAKHEPN